MMPGSNVSIETLQSQVMKTQALLSEMQNIPHEKKKIIFAWLICETPKIFNVPQRHFMNSQSDRCFMARSVCFYLTKKHGKLSLTMMAERFKVYPSTVKHGIEWIENALNVKTSFADAINTLNRIEENLNNYLTNGR